MPSCSRDNDTPLNCEHGCCGSSAAQECCSFAVSETLIIIASVVGALIVFTGVVVLIYCIVSKKKDAVTPISTPRRRPPRNREVAHRRRIPIMLEMPKPPPYSEAPPEYNSWNENNENTQTYPNIPSQDDTETYQVAPSRSSEVRRSPLPSTSGAVSVISSKRIRSQSDISLAFRASNVDSRSRQHNQSRSENRSRIDPLNTTENIESVHINEHLMQTGSSGEQSSVKRTNSYRSVAPSVTNTRPTNAHARDLKQPNADVALPGGVSSMSGSPPPTNPAAALRSAKRRAVLLHLERRRTRHIDSSSSDDE